VTVAPTPTTSSPATPTNQPTATPSPSPADTAEAFSFDTYMAGAFAPQKTTYYCVPASILTMSNLVGGRNFDISRATEDRLYDAARSYLLSPYWGRGAQPEGWAAVLNDEGVGPYEMAIRESREAALKLAARQLRATGRPVGLLVWRGYHAWVMSGFTSIGDPAKTEDFELTGLFIEDPWFPRSDTKWGHSVGPDTLHSMDQMTGDFLPYDQHGEGGPDKDGKFVVIIPTR
jgi:hypothetical protein